MLDIDFLEDFIKKAGLSEYKPNVATGFLTKIIENIATRYNGVIIYGIDHERGTEEGVVEFPLLSCNDIESEIQSIKHEFSNLGLSISIVCVEGLVLGKKAQSREEAYKGTPWRKIAYKKLLRIKRKQHALKEKLGDSSKT